MKKFFFIFFFLFFFILFSFQSPAWAESYDFQLVPRTTKSSSSDGYFSKIPLAPLPIKKGKLNFFKQSGWDFISFEGDYDEKIGELKGVFTGAGTSKNFPNSGAYYYCKFTAQVKKGQKNTTLKYYPTHGTAETLNHCYTQVVFDFEKNQKAPKDDWWPDDLVFDIQPLDSDGLEDSGVRFSDIAGEVEILLPTSYDDNGEPIFEDEEGWNHAQLDMALPYGAKLRLKEKSRIILTVPGSEPYELKTLENDDAIIILPTKQKKESIFKLMGGQLYNNVKKILKDGSMDIELGQAVAGIKGTTFILEETGNESKLAVLRGEVEFRSKTTGDKAIITGGERITASKKGLTAKETFDANTEQKKWENIKYFNSQNKTIQENKSAVNKNNQVKQTMKIINPRNNLHFYFGIIIFLVIVITALVVLKKLKRE